MIEDTPRCMAANTDPTKCNMKLMKEVCETGVSVQIMSEDQHTVCGIRPQKLYQCPDCKYIEAV